MKSLSMSVFWLIVGAALAAAILSIKFDMALGAAAPGLAATQATSTTVTVGTTPTIPVIATSTCAARIITTGASAIVLAFNGIPPTGLSGGGVLQGASTTVAYDGSLYGCGAVQVFSFAAQSIRVTDTR